NFAGMQFLVDGYSVTGGTLHTGTSGDDVAIRVGDSGPGDAAITATISAPLDGARHLIKSDGGTLVLSGTNTYDGGTSVNGGTLSVSSDANLGDAGGELDFNGGTLRVTGTDFDHTDRDIYIDYGGGRIDVADADNYL